MIMTCENFDVLNPISGDSYVYDCGWATLKIDGNQVKIHFAPSTSDDVALAHEEIQISANDGERKVYTLICFPESLTRMVQLIHSRRGCPKKRSSR